MAWCSIAVVMTCLRGLVEAATVPKIARLSASVPPLVKTISARLRADQSGNGFARGVNRSAGALSGRMDRACIAKVVREKRQHGFEDGGVHGRGRVVIKIDAHLRACRKRVCGTP